MKRIRQPKLSVERLEARDCPSFVLRLVDSTLFVTGSPTNTGTPQVLFTQTANNQWQVQDGTTILGKYNADSVYLSVTEHNNTPIDFNLGGHTAAGNITVNLGNGNNNPNPDLSHGLSIFNGQLNGNLTVLNGSGHEFVQLGYQGSNIAGTATDTTTIAGNVNFNLKEVPGQVSGGLPTGNFLDTGVDPSITPTVFIGGSLTTTGVNAVQLQTSSTVGQDVSVTTVRSQQVVGFAGDDFFGTIGGNLTIDGASSSPGDEINIGFGAPFTATIGGNVNINLGNGINQLENIGPFVIDGNTNIQMGNGNSFISLGGTEFGGTQGGLYQGNVNVQLGDGNNSDGTLNPNPNFFQPAPFLPASTSINGNFTLTAGNGNNNLTTPGNPFAAAVGGTTNITFGNGSDSPFTVASTNLGGAFNWHSGNSNDSLAFAGAATPASYNVNIQFGNGNDSLAFNDPAGTIFSGRADGGGRLPGGANTFFQAPGDILAPYFQLSNFP